MYEAAGPASRAGTRFMASNRAKEQRAKGSVSRGSAVESTTDIIRMMTIGALARSASQSKMPDWCSVKRPIARTVYEMVTRFRMYPGKQTHSASAVVRRQLVRRPSSLRGWVTSVQSSVTKPETCVTEKEGFDDEFDFDGDDEIDKEVTTATGESSSQQIYLRMCQKLNLTPRRVILRSIDLKHLDLNRCLLGPNGIRPVCVALMKNTTVRSLNLSNNDLGIGGASIVAQLIIGNSFIKELNVANNNLGTKGALYITEAIRETDLIKVLDISGNNLKEKDGVIIQNLIEECKVLKVLRASHNCFSEDGGKDIAKAIGSLDSLEVLDLSWNNLRLSGSQAIAQGLASTNSLKTMNLAWNGFHLGDTKELAIALERNSTLVELDLSANRIDTECLQELAKGLRNNSTLKVLKLAKIPITASGALFLLQTVYDLKSSAIQELDLGDQHVEPSFLAVLTQLRSERDIRVKHGAVLWQEVDLRDYEQELLCEDPAIVLIEFSELIGMGLMELFSPIDEKGEAVLTRAEMKKRLQDASMPLSDKAMEDLVASLETQGDGAIRYGRLLGEFEQLKHKDSDPPTVDGAQPSKVQGKKWSEMMRVRTKLRRLLRTQERTTQQAEQSKPTSLEPAPEQAVEEQASSSAEDVGVKPPEASGD